MLKYRRNKKPKPYFETKLGKLYHGDCLEIMPHLEPVDLVLTSPPYDDLRDYGGYKFDFKKTGKFLFELIKDGGVCIWIIGDQTKNGSESGTSFKHALHFMYFGFNLHDTMFFEKNSPGYPSSNRYDNVIEYMFVFSKGEIKTINLIKDRLNNWRGTSNFGTFRDRLKNGSLKKRGKKPVINRYGKRSNLWTYSTGKGYSTKDGIAFQHPAIFPDLLARDHIISWSNENDIVLDPMCGSGTTCKQAERLNRKWIGIEIEEKYCEIAVKRIKEEIERPRLLSRRKPLNEKDLEEDQLHLI